jgi:hypothetical protein
MWDEEDRTVRWLISCDESGIHGARFYGFGSLWMAWQRRGDFASDIQALRDTYGIEDELKWNKAHSKKNQAFFGALIVVHKDSVSADPSVSGSRSSAKAIPNAVPETKVMDHARTRIAANVRSHT